MIREFFLGSDFGGIGIKGHSDVVESIYIQINPGNNVASEFCFKFYLTDKSDHLVRLEAFHEAWDTLHFINPVLMDFVRRQPSIEEIISSLERHGFKRVYEKKT